MPLRFLTAGESHGQALAGILEGLPAGLALTAQDIQRELSRRKKGHGRGNRQKIETDQVEILAGVRRGATLGSPLALLIRNLDYRNWAKIMAVEPGPDADVALRRVDVPRPGHADLPGKLKYGFDDMRNVLERASARETAMRVALGAAARKLLSACGVVVASRVVAIGGEEDPDPLPCAIGRLNQIADASPVRCTDSVIEKRMLAVIDGAKAAGDTVGGIFEVWAGGLPVGLGSYVQWDRRLEAPLAAAVMSLNAVKGVEIGLGFESAALPGSQAHDEIALKGRRPYYRTNRAGGLLGGMTTGQPLHLRAAMKPLATLMKPLDSVNLRTRKPACAHVERSDVCAVPAAAVIAESLVCLVLADALLAKFGGDSMRELLARVRVWNP